MSNWEKSFLPNVKYLILPKFVKFWYQVLKFFYMLPYKIWCFIRKIGLAIWKGIVALGNNLKDLGQTIIHADWKTAVSIFIMGFGSIARGQIGRGILFLLFEIVFAVYMVFWGGNWLSLLPSLGHQGPTKEYNEIYDAYTTQYHDNSFKILLYGVLTIFFIIAFIITWRINMKQNRLGQEYIKAGKKLKTTKDDLHSLVDESFHKTLLALPTLGIIIFTVIPILFMILVAFTNYDGTHNGYSNNLFTWVGFTYFNQMLGWGNSTGSNFSATFGEVLSWTLIWAVFATFTNYFLGMFVAIMINKKGIKLKKMWRTILVLTIAVPQFISLLYISKLFEVNGIINGWIDSIVTAFGGHYQNYDFWGHKTSARILVIVINIWIGIPYLMLIATGILMNIPQDLYESARIDGANVWQQFTKITLPYMLFITGPYLLTSFTGNMNNFNVIYLLTGGGPTNYDASGVTGSVGYTDLLVTWLFKITQGAESQYYYAAVIGILIFVVVSVISLIVYNLLPSNKNEEDFQ